MTTKLIVAMALLAVGLGADKPPGAGFFVGGDMFKRKPLVDYAKAQREGRARQLITLRAQTRAAYRRWQSANWGLEPMFYFGLPAQAPTGLYSEGHYSAYVPGFGVVSSYTVPTSR